MAVVLLILTCCVGVSLPARHVLFSSRMGKGGFGPPPRREKDERNKEGKKLRQVKKRILATFAVLALVLAAIPAAHAATYEYPVNGGNLIFDPTTGTITDCDTSVYSADIPSEIYGVPVTAIGASAFKGCSKLTKTTIPSTVTHIGASAFMNCSSLTSITIPANVTRMDSSSVNGWGTFSGCNNLESVELYGNIGELPKYLFNSCSSLTQVVVGDGISKIGIFDFWKCNSLKEIVLPNSITEIASSAFSSCDNLTTVTIGNGVEYIDNYAFKDCSNLKSIYFSGNAPSIGNNIVSKFATGFTIYYPDTATGWSTPTWAGYVSKPYSLSGNDVPTVQPTPQPSTPVLPSGSATATPNASTVYVNGNPINFDAYTINGNNYFKLRDLAFVLSGSEVQFDVAWDQGANAIRLTSGLPYTPVGGELTGKGTTNQIAIPNQSAVLLDGNTTQLSAYTINGNNYFKLRDIGQSFNFFVTWDGVQNSILIQTNSPYMIE